MTAPHRSAAARQLGGRSAGEVIASCNSTLWRPCAHCPFRSDRPFGVRRARCEKIPTALFGRDLTFTCHETTEQPVPQHCAGALILHKKLGRPNWRIPFAGTLGLLYARRLHLDARVASCARVQAYCFRSRLPPSLTNGPTVARRQSECESDRVCRRALGTSARNAIGRGSLYRCRKSCSWF